MSNCRDLAWCGTTEESRDLAWCGTETLRSPGVLHGAYSMDDTWCGANEAGSASVCAWCGTEGLNIADISLPWNRKCKELQRFCYPREMSDAFAQWSCTQGVDGGDTDNDRYRD